MKLIKISKNRLQQRNFYRLLLILKLISKLLIRIGRSIGINFAVFDIIL